MKHDLCHALPGLVRLRAGAIGTKLVSCALKPGMSATLEDRRAGPTSAKNKGNFR